MARLIDLDKLAPPDVTVRIDGDDYRLPGDLPVEMYLSILEAGQRFEAAEGDTALAAMRDLNQRVLQAFQIRQPGLEELPIGVARIYALILSYYGAGDDEAEADPPVAARARSTTRKRRSSDGSAATATRTRN